MTAVTLCNLVICYLNPWVTEPFSGEIWGGGWHVNGGGSRASASVSLPVSIFQIHDVNDRFVVIVLSCFAAVSFQPWRNQLDFPAASYQCSSQYGSDTPGVRCTFRLPQRILGRVEGHI